MFTSFLSSAADPPARARCNNDALLASNVLSKGEAEACLSPICQSVFDGGNNVQQRVMTGHSHWWCQRNNDLCQLLSRKGHPLRA